jgi:hypothetical protein
MFFNSAAGIDLHESAVDQTLENRAGLRRALLVGTILGAGALMSPSAVRAADVIENYTTPQTKFNFSVSDTESVTLTSTSTGTIDAGAYDNGILGMSVDGKITIGGADGLRGTVKGLTGISVTALGSGAIDIKTASGGTISGQNDGIWAKVNGGSMTIDLGADVTGTNYSGIYAESTGTGAITVMTAANVAVKGRDYYGIGVVGAGGAIDIGGTAGLGGEVSAGCIISPRPRASRRSSRRCPAPPTRWLARKAIAIWRARSSTSRRPAPARWQASSPTRAPTSACAPPACAAQAA